MSVKLEIERMKSCARAGRRAAIALLLAAPAPALASGLFSHLAPHAPAKAAPTGSAAVLARQIRDALDERRLVDAGNLLDQANVGNVKSAELTTLRGDLMLLRGRFPEAIDLYKTVDADPTQRAEALEGEGLAKSLLGRSDDALTDLKAAIALDKTRWKAWNALGREYDLRRDWPKAKAAYATALAAPGANTAVVLNNRGYSQLLQNQATLAAADFVAALDKDPSLGAARTNLRIALAVEGHYVRASTTGVGDDRAAVLNNVGLAAAVRGDYIQADKLLNAAIAAKGQYYARAAENLELAHDLAARSDADTKALDVSH